MNHVDIPISDREVLRVADEFFAVDRFISARIIVRRGSGTRPSRNGFSLTPDQARSFVKALVTVLGPDGPQVPLQP